MGPSLEHIGRSLVELRVELAEVVMYRGGSEHAHSAALSLLEFEPLRLNDDTQALYEEDATQDGQQQLFMDDDGTHADDAANGERPRIAHEDLSGEGIVPQEADHGTYESAQEDYELL